MLSVAEALLAAQRVAGGPLRFDHYLAEALYGEAGFYSGGGHAGRRGDFITSAEIGPLFGAVLARWIGAQFDRLGQPDDFQIVEMGAGTGTLARAILEAAPQWVGRYLAVELSSAQRALQPTTVTSLASLPGDPIQGVVIANELLDNVPFRLAVFDDEWREAIVEVAPDGSLREHLVAAPPEWSWLPATASLGARLPIQQQAHDLIESIRSRMTSGSLLTFDYCVTSTAQLAGRPWRDWLRTYRGHERGTHYLRHPGAQDITAEVCLDQLPPGCLSCPQADFLRRWGIEELVAEGRANWLEAATAPTVASLRMRSRIREAESLLDTGGLGGFTALEWTVDSSATVVAR